MAKIDRPARRWTGEEDHLLHATWSRSGKNLILTVARDQSWQDYQQVLLTPDQAVEVAAFLNSGPEPRT